MPKFDKYWRNVVAVAVTVTDSDVVVISAFTKNGEMPGVALDIVDGEIRVMEEYDK